MCQMKTTNKEMQQLKVDTGLTQLAGKPIIVIKQCSGGMKQSTNFFDTSIRVQKIGLTDLIFLLEFLLQNSTIVFIQERGEGTPMPVRP